MTGSRIVACGLAEALKSQVRPASELQKMPDETVKAVAEGLLSHATSACRGAIAGFGVLTDLLDHPCSVAIDDVVVQEDPLGDREHVHVVLGRLLANVGLVVHGVLRSE